MVDADSKQELDMIAKAHLAAERLEKANEINKELIKRMEAIEARRVLGGQSTAGEATPKEITEEEKVRIGMKQYFKGTIVEDALR